MTYRLLRLGALALFCASFVSAQEHATFSLQRAIEIAQQHNPRIVQAQRAIDAALGKSLQARRIANPELEFSWDQIPSFLSLGKADERDIGLSQSIEYPARRSARIDVADRERMLAEFELERERRVLTARVKKAYYRLWHQQNLSQELHNQIRLLEDMQAIVLDRFKNGSAAYADVLRARLEIARLNNDAIDAERDLAIRRSECNVLLGRAAEASLVPSDSIRTTLLRSKALTLVDSLSEASFYLKMAQARLSRQDASVALARSSYYPDLTLGIAYQLRKGEAPYNLNGFTGTNASVLGVRVGLSLPLWFWNDQQGQVQEAMAERSIAETGMASALQNVRANIIAAESEVQAARARVASFDRSLVSDADDLVKLSRTQYQNGQIDLLNLLDIHRSARAIHLDHAKALLQLAVAEASLESAGELPAEE